jgi:hypothetical protein
MAYRRFSDGRRLLSAQNISINFVLYLQQWEEALGLEA